MNVTDGHGDKTSAVDRRLGAGLPDWFADPFLAELPDCEGHAPHIGLVAATDGLAVVSLAWHLDPFTGRREFQPVPLRPGQTAASPR